MHYLRELLFGSWTVTGQMAPYLLFGFAMAGLLSILVSAAWVERHLGGRGIVPILKAVLFGIPLPLCSCGVIPVTASIRRHGASRGATTGFLLATPQTGVDSILATWGTLGAAFGVFRPLAALVTGLVGGALVSVLVPEQGADPAAPTESDDAQTPRAHGLAGLVKAARYGFVTLPRDIGKALIVGILVAGLIATFVEKGALAPYLGGGPAATALMMLVGIPIYVCSTASIPVAIGFMHMGASPGAALAFLIAGPATNAATIAMTWKVLGRRTAIVYLATVAGGAMLAGMGLDALVGPLGRIGLSLEGHVHGVALGWPSHVAAVALAVVVIAGVVSGLRRPAAPAAAPAGPAGGRTVAVRVTGMTCSHCRETVARGLREVPGVAAVEVDLDAGRALVTGDDLDPAVLVKVVTDLGYGAEPASPGG